ncbi:MAG: DUF3194 domain-containing protein [Candidatus Thorarchaeota archaeon]|jgi:hypothetical protein
MSPAPTEIGLPSLNDQQIESLAEECEDEITNFILSKIPKKSIAEISVSCILDFDKELDVDVQLDLEQSYDTGHNLDEILDAATRYGTDWLENRLKELKVD